MDYTRPLPMWVAGDNMAVVSDPTPYMQTALKLAARGQGTVEPNPMVGAVLVRHNRVLATGWHRKFGGPHAEIDVLNQVTRAGSHARGATLYVTLEPCAHHGKTPPCTDALIDAGVARVVAAMQDPNPEVAGRGLRKLRNAGVDVEVGLLQDEAVALNAPFVKRHTTGLPWTIAKWAQTLDGATATRTGHSQWISNDKSRHVVHQLRARVDVVMVGINTALSDDPTLTARHVRRRRVAMRVIIDPRLRLPVNSQLVRTIDQAPLLVVTKRAAMREKATHVAAMRAAGVKVIFVPTLSRRRHRANPALDLGALLRRLVKDYDATNVLVEGGAHLLGTLFADDLVDQALAFVAPRLLGDAEALGSIVGLKTERINDGQRLMLRHCRNLAGDLMLDYRVVPRSIPPKRPLER